MRVIRYKYYRDDAAKYSLNKIDFDWINLQETNLFVGKNASGKTTLSRILATFSAIFLPSNTALLGELYIDLENNKKDVFKYHIKWDFPFVESETLHINDKLIVKRNKSTASIYSDIRKDSSTINPPANNTVIQVRRDEKEYPYFEELATWAKGIYLIKFADAHPNSLLFGTNADINNKEINKALDSLTDQEKDAIISEFNSLGYDIQVISIEKEGEQNILFIQEEGVAFKIRQNLISQGMFRSLLVLIYLHYLIEKQKATLIIIDDLCEGLDYDRASNLGRIIFNKMTEKNVQFIATSNDFFLMNIVDIENWNVINRIGGLIKSYNYKNSKEKFDEFRFTGLNNFQLFASDYLNTPE